MLLQPISYPFIKIVNYVCLVTYVNEKELDEAGSKAAQHLKLDVYRPKDTDPNDSCPVLIFIHGGKKSIFKISRTLASKNSVLVLTIYNA